ncbi:uncharacterized protein TRUGW13939_08533 [Talaromyces rugulosus]|uniref:Zn(2)-C6 fungal-type domain-containing protein n=1 Tax=Talaromyces rugulosus TaxID=121627 RepID=A0A7H8R713_TALRU|nr:uncharacterized protein TRUGW13939_08533 [Talaromyces rugulosus]QKX61385.1 hypothetical protein TRUGW13939_08533 [Talaromyces rugulosus]
MSSQSQVPCRAGHRRPQHRRSRNGCLTCKRRKVRCNEEKPRCYHCDRLSLECVWNDSEPPADMGREEPARADRTSSSTDMFDFAQSIVEGTVDLSTFQDIYFPPFSDLPMPVDAVQDRVLFPNPATPRSTLGLSQSPVTDVHVDDLNLPPILDPVENGPKLASVKALFHSLAASSWMVRYAIAAFAAIQFSSAERKADYKAYYDKAAYDLSEAIDTYEGFRMLDGQDLRCALATIFFLTYIDLLTGEFGLACSNLETAHYVLQGAGIGALGPIEQRIVSWIRLLDARAASAGGKGRLVNDTSKIVKLMTPSSPSTTHQSTNPAANSGPQEVIYEMLCQPGIAFYQEVQTITVRITGISHAHRSRGSVEDETEVMAIAADILRDLTSLYAHRPTLMDFAVSGNIGEDALAEPLASAIVRSFQTYLANFYACYIHLHRVAHRHLARSNTVVTAINKIKEILHLMASSNEYIPVNMLWPLFLWGSEEDDRNECQWILKTTRSLHDIVTNANMAANALQEIQTRQQEAGSRVDIHSVFLELFNTTFAMV